MMPSSPDRPVTLLAPGDAPVVRESVNVAVIERPDAELQREISVFLTLQSSAGAALAQHDPRWLDVLAAGFGHRPYVILARAAVGPASIAGYLPLVLVSSRLFGRFLVSLPYVDCAGVVVAEAATAEKLIDAAVRLAADLDADYLELRHDHAFAHPELHAQRTDKVRMMLELPATLDLLWQQVGSKVRNQARKGERCALAIQWGGTELVDDFYTVFAENMRDLGTPVFPKQLFTSTTQCFAAAAELAVVRHQGRPVAAALLVHSGAERALARTHIPSAASRRSGRAVNANMWMYYQLLARAIERGSRQIDFGRSTVDSSTYRFKKQWGAQAQPTVWQYHVRRGGIDAARPNNPRYALAIALWRHLPVALTRWLGPPLARGIP